MEKATNVAASTRRNHAAVRAVTPAQGSGEASSNCTAVVVPIANESTLPTARQYSGRRRNKGATTKPAIGTSKTSEPRPKSPKISRSKNFRRDNSSGVAGGGCGSVLSFMANVSNPARHGDGEHNGAEQADEGRTDYSPKEKGDGERGGGRPNGRLGQMRSRRWR